MHRPLVTIVTPSYNQGQFIRATIESVLSQDYPNIEYIIMDGGSTDDTAKVVSEYAGRLTFISEKDRGQSHAINKGFRMARGEIVAWLNSDDLILPGAVRLGVEAFERNPKIGAVYGEGNLIDYDGNVKMRFPATVPFDLWFLIHVSDFILQQTTYFRKDIFDEIGYLDETLNWGMDWDLLIRIGKKYPIEYIPEFMGCLREYDQAKTFSGGHRRFRELVRIMRRHGDLRYPPGYINYGLATYEDIICRRLPSEFMRFIVRFVGDFICSRTLYHRHGLYKDRWASRRLRYMLPPGSGSIRISGTLPPRKELEQQVLAVRLAPSFSQRFHVPFGDFSIDVRPPEDLASKTVSIDVLAEKFVKNSRFHLRVDPVRRIMNCARILVASLAERREGAGQYKLRFVIQRLLSQLRWLWWICGRVGSDILRNAGLIPRLLAGILFNQDHRPRAFILKSIEWVSEGDSVAAENSVSACTRPRESGL